MVTLVDVAWSHYRMQCEGPCTGALGPEPNPKSQAPYSLQVGCGQGQDMSLQMHSMYVRAP